MTSSQRGLYTQHTGDLRRPRSDHLTGTAASPPPPPTPGALCFAGVDALERLGPADGQLAGRDCAGGDVGVDDLKHPGHGTY